MGEYTVIISSHFDVCPVNGADVEITAEITRGLRTLGTRGEYDSHPRFMCDQWIIKGFRECASCPVRFFRGRDGEC